MLQKPKIKFHIITIFPQCFESYLKTSILGRALKKKIISAEFINLRDFSSDKHKTVDDAPYGGGPGMVLKIEPIFKALQFVKRKALRSKINPKTILFSARGRKFDSKKVKELAQLGSLILICGRYEGVDERVARYLADEEISIGDYILSGGELPAMVLMEAVSRQIPGVLGKKESLEDIKGSYPSYSRPPVFVDSQGKKMKVPKTLLSGNHKEISAWRRKHSKKLKFARLLTRF